MTQQVMVDGVVFALAGEDVVVFGRRLRPNDMKKLSSREKILVSKAVDLLAGISLDGSVLARRYKTV